jgi:hypothetical protein
MSLSKSTVSKEAAGEMLKLYNTLPDPLMQVLATADDWQFDAFKVGGWAPLCTQLWCSCKGGMHLLQALP